MNEYRYFKFRAINKRLLESLLNGTLYFSQPSRLNDPFDCQVDISKAASAASRRVSGDKREYLRTIANIDGYLGDIQQRIAEVSICSFSLTLAQSILWSHYADEHRGVALIYEFTEKFLNDASTGILGASEVEYGENPLTDWLVENVPEQINDDFYAEFTMSLIKKTLIIKAKNWEYEQEVRIIRGTEGVFEIPRAFLKIICFGLNTSDSDMRLIKKIIDGSGYAVNYRRMTKRNSDFGIEDAEI